MNVNTLLFFYFVLGNNPILLIGGLNDTSLKAKLGKQEIFIPNYYHFKYYYKDLFIS